MTNVHPKPFEIIGMEQPILADGGEGLLFDGGRAQVNPLEDTGVQKIDTGVDSVTDELDWFLDEAIDARGVVWLVDDNTILGGLIHLGHHDGSLITMVLVEFRELLKGVITDDIGVEDEEWRIILAQDLFGQFQGPRGAQGFGLDGKFDSDIILFLILNSQRHQHMHELIYFPPDRTHLLQGRHHHIRTVVDGQHNISHARGSQALDLVQDHGPVSKLHQRFRKCQCLFHKRNE